MRTRTKQNKKRGTIFIRRKSSESYSKGRDSISCCQRGRYEYGRKNRRRKGKEKSRHFPTIQWVHRANLWGRKEGRNGVQKLPKRQDELIAFSFLKNKKQTERKNLDAFPHFFPPPKSSGQNRIRGQISAAEVRANAEIIVRAGTDWRPSGNDHEEHENG